MKKNINQILKEVLKKVNPSEKDLSSINKFLKDFILEIKKELKKKGIDAEVFVGGSSAKKTLIKKGQYDVDIFVRFNKKYGNDISNLTEKILKETKRHFSTIHGSRDYFKINVEPSFFVEIIPVVKVKNPKESDNITDLSYFHVDYIKKRLKTEKMLEEVRLAKAFCHANKCYGAESYINGFSGYALELLVYHYKGFFNFVKAMIKIDEKEIIDIEKLYKNKREIEMNMNSSKMISPIILIDPTYKERNALAALSKETFNEFKEVCRKFIKNPSEDSFETKRINLERIKDNARKNKSEFVLIVARTDKQEGDIAGSKLVKFYRHLGEEIEKFYKITNKDFEYHDKKEAEYFFVVKSKKEIILSGPNANDEKNVALFQNRHKDTFVKKGKIYAREKIKDKINDFVEEWKNKNKEKIREMGITGLEIIN
jgi:tRNA nucleotidyltransferase (CCA-adding enzyme)